MCLTCKGRGGFVLGRVLPEAVPAYPSEAAITSLAALTLALSLPPLLCVMEVFQQGPPSLLCYVHLIL